MLLEVNCETDFAARSDDFQGLVHDVAMHVAAAAPRFVDRNEVGEDFLREEREIAKSGKPEKVIDKIVEGKIEKIYSEICLLEQPFVKDPSKTVGQHITDHVARIGENIQVARFSRFVLGETATG